ncbi:MAG: SiaB family protein kinase [Crocinitomicaceae bacterium]
MSLSTMALTEVYDFFKRMEDEKIILSFKGELSPELLTSILQILERKIQEIDFVPLKRKRIFSVLVECFQNLYHHIGSVKLVENTDDVEKSALIIVKYIGEKFIVRTGNYIYNTDIPELENKLKSVNELNTEELKILYQSKLKSEVRSIKGTAGLGFIDIARKSKGKLDYEFLEIDSKSSFFCLNVTID